MTGGQVPWLREAKGPDPLSSCVVKYVAKLGLRKYNLGVSYQIFKEGKV